MTLMMRDLENQEIGIQKGREEERREQIADMLKKGKNPQEISDFCGYPLDLILDVQNSILVTS